MSGRSRAPRWVLGVVLIASCERSAPGHPAATTTTSAADVHDAATMPAVVDGGTAGMGVPQVPPPDAGQPIVAPRDMPWRKVLDEVVRRIDRGDPPARIAAVFGRVTEVEGGLRVESTLPWVLGVDVSGNGKEISVWFSMVPPLPRAELEAGAGPCEIALMGEFADALMLLCPPFDTRRGIMEVSAVTKPEPDRSMVNSLRFEWRLPIPGFDKPRGR